MTRITLQYTEVQSAAQATKQEVTESLGEIDRRLTEDSFGVIFIPMHGRDRQLFTVKGAFPQPYQGGHCTHQRFDPEAAGFDPSPRPCCCFNTFV